MSSANLKGILAFFIRAKRSPHPDFDLFDDGGETETWRGSMTGSSVDEWKRIEEGQRVLQLSNSLWFGTECGPFDMKDHERYELLYGRPIGVEDPMLVQIRQQRHQTERGIYVQPGRSVSVSTAFTPFQSMDGMVSNNETSSDGQCVQQPLAGRSERDTYSSDSKEFNAAERSSISHILSLQRNLQPSMSWQFRMTHFNHNEVDDMHAARSSMENIDDSGVLSKTPQLRPGPVECTPTRIGTPIASFSSGHSSRLDSEASATTLIHGRGNAEAAAGDNTPAAADKYATGRLSAGALQPPAPHIDHRTSAEREEEDLVHMAWRWRFTKRWCKEQNDPPGEPSKREAAYAAALAGQPSGAWSHLLRRTSTEGGHDRESHTLSESMLFSEGGEDHVGAGRVSWCGGLMSNDGRAVALGAYMPGTGAGCGPWADIQVARRMA